MKRDLCSHASHHHMLRLNKMIDSLNMHPVIVLHMLRCMTDQAHYSDKYGCDRKILKSQTYTETTPT